MPWVIQFYRVESLVETYKRYNALGASPKLYNETDQLCGDMRSNGDYLQLAVAYFLRNISATSNLVLWQHRTASLFLIRNLAAAGFYWLFSTEV